MYAEQEIVKLWKSLLPQITEISSGIEIKIKGKAINLIKQKPSSELINIKNISYR